MATNQERLKAQVRYTYHFISSCVAYQVQGRIGGQLLRKRPCFAHSVEGAPADCGEIDDELVFWSRSEEERYFRGIPQQKNIHALVAMDYKTLLPYVDEFYKGGQYHHQFAITPAQAVNTVAFIIASPLLPSYVALIPQWYLANGSKKTDIEQPAYYGPEIPMVGVAAEAFPPNWSPFILPLESHLALGLKSLVDFANGRARNFQNPFTRIVFEGAPRSPLRPLSDLLPSEDNSIGDFSFIQCLWNAFDAGSEKYRIERIVTQPSVGDFMIRHIESGEQVAVEVKLQALRMQGDGSLNFSPIRPLPPNSVWDLLLGTEIDTKSSRDERHKPNFWIFSRDEAPQHFFQSKVQRAGTSFVWPEPYTGFFRKCRVRWSSDQVMVRCMEDILDARRAARTYRASGVLQFSRRSVAPPPQQRVKLVNPQQRGLQGKWSEKLWQAEQHDRLQRSCTRNGGGRVFYLPAHPAARFAYTPFCGSETTFCELSPFAITIYLNFATISVTDELFATDCRRPTQFRFAVQGTSPSLFLLVPHVEDHRKTNKAYLVPSSLLNTMHWRTYMKRLKSTALRDQARNPVEVSLRGGMSLKRYRLHLPRLAEVLERLAVKNLSPDPARLYNINRLLEALGKFATICENKQHVVREYALGLGERGICCDSDSD